jgi:hypothetical protein
VFDTSGVAWGSEVTFEEMEILKTLHGTAFQAFFPKGRSIAAAETFDALVESLLHMQRSGWIELQVEPSKAVVGYYQRKYKAAVARCTDVGREALKSASWVTPTEEETPPPKIP